MKKHSDIYFDHITSTPCPKKTRERLSSMLEYYWTSPTAPYPLGQRSASFIQEMRDSIQKKMKIEDRSVQLTHSRLETVSTYKHIVVSAHEQLDTLKTLFALQDEDKIKVTLLPIGPRGYIEKETIEAAITSEDTCLLLPSVDLCSGVIQPLEIPESLHVVLDITHTFGKTHFSLTDCKTDDILFDLTALGSPIPLFCLASKNQHDSHNTPFEWGLTESVLEENVQNAFLFSTEVVRLRDLFERELKSVLPSVWVLHQEEERIPHLSTCIFPKIKNEALLFLLSRKNLFASMGGGNVQTLSSQLSEQGYAPHIAQGALSFSFTFSTTEEEILESVQRIKEAYELLTKIGFQDE